MGTYLFHVKYSKRMSVNNVNIDEEKQIASREDILR